MDISATVFEKSGVSRRLAAQKPTHMHVQYRIISIYYSLLCILLTIMCLPNDAKYILVAAC